jgi:hypothetical protein
MPSLGGCPFRNVRAATAEVAATAGHGRLAWITPTRRVKEAKGAVGQVAVVVQVRSLPDETAESSMGIGISGQQRLAALVEQFSNEEWA